MGFLEVLEVTSMKSVLLWFVVFVFVHCGVQAEIELYPDVTSDDYPLDELSVILRNQQQLFQQQQQQRQQRQLQRGEQPLEEAVAAAMAAEAEAEAEEAAAAAAAERHLKYPREAVTLAAAVAAAAASRGQLARLGLAGHGGDALAAVADRQPAFSYSEPAGQAGDGQRAPFAYSPADPRFYEDTRPRIPETDRGAKYSGSEFVQGSGSVGVSPQEAPPAAAAAASRDAPELSSWRQRLELGQDAAAVAAAGSKLASAPTPAQQQHQAPSPPSPPETVKKAGQEKEKMIVSDGNGILGGDGGGGGSRTRDAGVAKPAPPNAALNQGDDDAAPPAPSPPAASQTVANVPGVRPAMTEDEDDYNEGEQAKMLVGASQASSNMVQQKPVKKNRDNSDLYFIAIVAGCCAAAVVGIIAVGISWYRLQKSAKAAADVEYPAYGVTGPNKDVSPTGDRRLAQSAQMYHYQHQKQQIIAMESRIPAERNGSVSEAESEEENEEGDYTVYECPGLAPTGEMEVKNPLFLDDPTPATPATGPVPGVGSANGVGGQGASACGAALVTPATLTPSTTSASSGASSPLTTAAPTGTTATATATAHKTSAKGDTKQQQQPQQPKQQPQPQQKP